LLSTYVDDGTYEYTNDGSGRTIYILDSGLNLDIQAVADEFGGRASVFWAAETTTIIPASWAFLIAFSKLKECQGFLQNLS
jgi:hypothetical protein